MEPGWQIGVFDPHGSPGGRDQSGCEPRSALFRHFRRCADTAPSTRFGAFFAGDALGQIGECLRVGLSGNQCAQDRAAALAEQFERALPNLRFASSRIFWMREECCEISAPTAPGCASNPAALGWAPVARRSSGSAHGPADRQSRSQHTRRYCGRAHCGCAGHWRKPGQSVNAVHVTSVSSTRRSPSPRG